LQTALRVVVPGAFSGLAAAFILGISRAVGETMVVAIAAGMQPNLTFDPREPAATITAYIVQVSLGDLPHGSIGYQSIFAAGLVLMLITLIFNVIGFSLTRRFARPTDERCRDGTVSQRRSAARGPVAAQAARPRLRRGWPGRDARVSRRSRRAVHRSGARRIGTLRLELLHQLRVAARTNAGILAAWVGTSLIMLVHCGVRSAGGCCGSHLSRGYAPKNWLTAIIEINVTNLAGVPSIVYGLLALGLFVYQFDLGPEHRGRGPDARAVDLPIVIVATRESIRSVPKAIREAAYGLGATRWEVTKDHVLPYSTAACSRA
jgi:ABC-type phosphate transport system permease subunit